ncbi:MAG TPA: hypothetical protein PKK06_02680 [Phycisphaerae bacterium]|nr:hypothetical protein [Phycisphaerae bacterium]HNU44591.1 hypothetical protein [Phycisphaerae bacterium]
MAEAYRLLQRPSEDYAWCPPSTGCDWADADKDGDVDRADYGDLQGRFDGL